MNTVNSLTLLIETHSGLLAAGVLLLTVSVLGNLALWWRSHRLATQLLGQSKQLADLDRRLTMLASGSLSIGERVVNLEAELAKVASRQDALAHNDHDFSYTQAMTLLQQGIAPEHVALSCGLSQSEVGLMALIYQNKHASVA